jgi:hypothetical protein
MRPRLNCLTESKAQAYCTKNVKFSTFGRLSEEVKTITLKCENIFCNSVSNTLAYCIKNVTYLPLCAQIYWGEDGGKVSKHTSLLHPKMLTFQPFKSLTVKQCLMHLAFTLIYQTRLKKFYIIRSLFASALL